jgi:hypothetical protein
VVAVSDQEVVAQKGDSGLDRLTEVVSSFERNDHFGLKAHLRRVLIAHPMEQAANVGRLPPLVANRHGGVNQSVVRERAEETDGIEKIRLAYAVCARNAGERPESDVDIDKVLEAGYSQSGQHERSSRCTLYDTVKRERAG